MPPPLSQASQARIAALYLPLITILIENKTRLTPRDPPHHSPNSAPPNGEFSSSAASSVSGGDTPSRSATLGSYASQQSLEQSSVGSGVSLSLSRGAVLRDPNVFSIISGQGRGSSGSCVG